MRQQVPQRDAALGLLQAPGPLHLSALREPKNGTTAYGVVSTKRVAAGRFVGGLEWFAAVFSEWVPGFCRRVHRVSPSSTTIMEQ